MIIYIKAIRKPRTPKECINCNGVIITAHIDIYGFAESGDPPYHTRLCLKCAKTHHRAEIRALAETIEKKAGEKCTTIQL